MLEKLRGLMSRKIPDRGAFWRAVAIGVACALVVTAAASCGLTGIVEQVTQEVSG